MHLCSYSEYVVISHDDGRTYYIARSHEGGSALLDDLDSEADTITIKTQK